MRTRTLFQSAAAAMIFAAGNAAAQATFDQSELLTVASPFGNGTISSVTASGDGVLISGEMGDESGDFSRLVWSVDNFSPLWDFSDSMTVGVRITLQDFNLPYINATPFVQTTDGMGNFDFVEGSNIGLMIGQTVEYTIDLSGTLDPAAVARFGMQFYGPGPLFPGEEPVMFQIDPLPPVGCGPADMNSDGFLNNTDINLFVNTFLAGCQSTGNGLGMNPYTDDLETVDSLFAIVGSLNGKTTEPTGTVYNAELADSSGFTALSLAYLYANPVDVTANDYVEFEVTLVSGQPVSGRLVLKEGPGFSYVAAESTTELAVGVPTILSFPTDLLSTPEEIREINFEFYGPDPSEVADNTVEIRIRPLSSSCGPADLNDDGNLNNTDINLFVNLFLAGCP